MPSVRFLPLALASAFAPAALAQTAPMGTEPARTGPVVEALVEGAVEMGGDRFLKVYFTNGGDQTMRAGQGGTIALGLQVRPSATSPFLVRGTAGLKYVTTAASNANIRLLRVPLELTAHAMLPQGLRAGAGVVAHVANRFDGDGFVDDVSFDPSVGATAEVGWKWIALTGTLLTYSADGRDDVDASSVGVSLVYPIFRLR